MPTTRLEDNDREIDMDAMTKFITPGIAFLLTLAFGVWVSHAGRPYNGILSNIHKLIALGAVIVTAIQIFKALQNTEIQMALIALIVVTGLCVVALFATGAMMSMDKLNYAVMLTVHRIAPVVAVIAMVAMVCLLGVGKP